MPSWDCVRDARRHLLVLALFRQSLCYCACPCIDGLLPHLLELARGRAHNLSLRIGRGQRTLRLRPERRRRTPLRRRRFAFRRHRKPQPRRLGYRLRTHCRRCSLRLLPQPCRRSIVLRRR